MRCSSEQWWGGLVSLDTWHPHQTDAREGTFRWLGGVLEVSGIIGVFSDIGGACSGGQVSANIQEECIRGYLISYPLSETRPRGGGGERTVGQGRLWTQDTKLLTTNKLTKS